MIGSLTLVLALSLPAHAERPAIEVASPETGTAAMAASSTAVRWGAKGHQIAARTALEHLPSGLPSFFPQAADQLEWLNPEPDRWRVDGAREMNEGFRYDHYVDLENAPHGTMNASDRWTFIQELYGAGVENPHRDVGFAFFHVLELYQRLQNGFIRWRAEPNPRVRGWIEERIIHDAGILGHYVTDLANPHHTTIHFNGWDESKMPNPGGFATDNGTHARFESRFVEAHVELGDVVGTLTQEPRVFSNVRGAFLEFLLESNSQTLRLYQLDRDVGFAANAPAHPEAKAFAVERLSAGARMLRDLWWTAWVTSEGAD